MSKEVINELNRLIRNPRITFEKGLLETLNDTHLGFVSELNNMEVENGVVSNRLGTYNLLREEPNKSWVACASTLICGVSVLLLVDAVKREVHAIVEGLQGRLLPVYKHGIDPLIDNTLRLKFTEGSKFFINSTETDNHIYLFNNTTQAFRINKTSFIQFCKVWDKGDNVNLANQHIYSPTDNVGIYLDIQDISFKNTVVFAHKTDDDSIPLRGNWRYAELNKAGMIGKWSEIQNLGNEYHNYIFSTFDERPETLKVNDGRVEVRCVPTLNTSDGEQYFVWNNDTAESFLSVDYNPGIIWRPAVVLQTPNGNQWVSIINGHRFEPIPNTFTNDNGHLILRDVKPLLRNNNTDFFSFSVTAGSNEYSVDAGTSTASINLTEYYTRLFQGGYSLFTGDVQEEEIFGTVGSSPREFIMTEPPIMDGTTVTLTMNRTAVNTASGISFFPFSTTGQNTKAFILERQLLADMIEDDTAPFGFSLIGLNNDAEALTGAWNSAGLPDYSERQLYKVRGELPTSGASLDTIEIFGTAVDTFLEIEGESVFRIYLCKIATIGSSVANTIHYAKAVMKPEKEISETANTILYDRNYNTWDLITASFNIEAISDDTLAVEFPNSNEAHYAVIAQRSEIPQNTGFVVWHENKIIGKTQKVFWEFRPKYFLGPTGFPVQNSSTQFVRNFTIKYMPILRTEGRTLFEYPYNIDEFTETINYPQHLVINNGIIYAVQNNNIYTGIAERGVLTARLGSFDTIYAMEKLYGSAVVFHKEGIVWIAPGGGFRQFPTHDMKSHKVIATTSYGGSAYVVTDTNEVYKLRIVVTDDGSLIPEKSLISGAIVEHNFGAYPKMTACGGIVWIGHGDTVLGFENGVWSRKYKYPHKTIAHLTHKNDELVVVFGEYEPALLISSEFPPSELTPPLEEF